jgi:hypothetical protein
LSVLPSCKSFQIKPKDGGEPGVPDDAGAEPGTGGSTSSVANDPGAGRFDAMPISFGTGGSPATIGTGGGGPADGSAGEVAPDCIAGTTRLCMDDPALKALGNCGTGVEVCAADHWGGCSVQPAPRDSCALVGDDASCNGKPNEGCPCVDGATQACGPGADVGICKRGTQTCAGSVWGACVGAVYSGNRDCTSTADNDCDGSPDNALDAVCVCATTTKRPCDEHPGKDGTGRCKAGSQTCVLAADKKSSAWGACSGGIAPAAKDTCDPGNDDNCSGVPNEGCACVAGTTQACGPAAAVGLCKRGSQTCTSGTWGACVGAVQAVARDCTSPADNDCDGAPDNTVDAVCGCSSGATRVCNAHAGKDGNGPCKAGSQSCVVAADKKSSAWGACTGAVGPAAADTCDATNDNNCNGIPHDSCTCVNGTTRACGPSATGICKPGTQTCVNATWGTSCTGAITAQPRDCTSTKDNDCNGNADNLESTCVCAAGTTGACPGTNNPQCITGTRTCVLSTDKGSTSWSSTCAATVGAPCGVASCVTSASGTTTFTPGGTCNSSAACSVGASAPCANGRSCASSSACSTTCSGATGCATGYVCSGTTCVAKKGPGGSCTSTADCTMGFCADGVCCNRACTGSCEACGSTGTCANVTGAPHAGHPACTGTGSCVGSCNGQGASCTFPGSGTQCRPATCTLGVATVSASCNGAGSCPAASTQTCSPYVCGATSCANPCKSNADCIGTNFCTGGICQPKKANGSVCSAQPECSGFCGGAPGRCCAAPCTCPQQSPRSINLFPNAGMDIETKITGWGILGGLGLQWSSEDVDGCPYSGSIQTLGNSDINPSTCVNVTPGGTYTFGGWFKNALAGAASGGFFTCALVQNTQPNCSGPEDIFATIGGFTTNGTETQWTRKSTPILVPSTVQSVRLACDCDPNTFIDKLFLSPGTNGQF